MNPTQSLANEDVPATRRERTMLNQSIPAADHFWHDSAISISALLPFQTAHSLRLLRSPRTWILPVFAFAPLALNGWITDVKQIPVFLVPYAALAWAAYFYVFVAKRASSLWLGLGSAAFTIAIGVRFVLLFKATLLAPLYAWSGNPSGIARLVGFLGSSMNEEVFKALPLLLAAFGLRRIKNPRDGIFYGALSGVGFAAFEGYRYMLRVNESEFPMQMLLRSISLPLLHATWTAIVGYFIARAAISRRRLALCLIGIITAAILHGFYDAAPRIYQMPAAVAIYLIVASYIEMSQGTAQELRVTEAAQGAAS